jgi:hypothetical protein
MPATPAEPPAQAGPPPQGGPPPISQPFPQQQYTRYALPLPQNFPPPFSPPRRSRARLVLVLAAVVAFAVAGVFGALYVGADGDHDAAVSLLDERTGQLADTRQQLGTAEDELADAQDRNADLEAAGAPLKACVDAVQHYLWDTLTDAETTAAIDTMFTVCQ